MAKVFIYLFIYLFIRVLFNEALHDTQSNLTIMFSTNKVAVFDDMFSEVFILIPPAPETKWSA
jgi:hypothetical protein